MYDKIHYKLKKKKKKKKRRQYARTDGQYKWRDRNSKKETKRNTRAQKHSNGNECL